MTDVRMSASSDMPDTHHGLPDDVLHKVLSYDGEKRKRTVLPLVCTRWREVLYLQGARPYCHTFDAPRLCRHA